MHSTHDNTEQKLEQTAYFIGDGPEAHLCAIKFKQKGMKNVVVIGTRFDAFTRSVSFNQAVFEKLSESIAPLEVKPSDSRHIKDTEIQMHSQAKEELGVKFITGRFTGFADKNTLIIVDEQERPTLIPIHPDSMVYDNTGTAHAVLDGVNTAHEYPIYSFTYLDKNPHKTYASMRMSFIPEVLNVSNLGETVELNPVSQVLALEELRDLGWKSYAIPYCNHYLQPSKSGREDKKQEKYVLYFQVPELEKPRNEAEKLQARILAIRVSKILLKLFRNDPTNRDEPAPMLLKKSRKHPTKQHLSVFNVEPCVSTPYYHKQDEQTPTTFHAGDSTFPMPFVMGKSFLCDIDRTNLLIDCVTIVDGFVVAFDYKKYEDGMKEKLQNNIGEVNDFLMSENKRIEDANINARRLYELAHAQCQNPHDKAIIAAGLKRMNSEYSLFLAQSIEAFITMKAGEEKTADYRPSYKKLDELIVLIISDRERLNESVMIAIEKLAEYCKNLGNEQFKSNKFPIAIELFEKAINIHNQFLRRPDLLLNIYSNLIASYSKMQKYEEVINYVQIAEKMMPSIDAGIEKNATLIDRININKANALISKYKKESIEQLSENLHIIEAAVSCVKNSEFHSKLTKQVKELKEILPTQLQLQATPQFIPNN